MTTTKELESYSFSDLLIEREALTECGLEGSKRFHAVLVELSRRGEQYPLPDDDEDLELDLGPSAA